MMTDLTDLSSNYKFFFKGLNSDLNLSLQCSFFPATYGPVSYIKKIVALIDLIILLST